MVIFLGCSFFFYYFNSDFPDLSNCQSDKFKGDFYDIFLFVRMQCKRIDYAVISLCCINKT